MGASASKQRDSESGSDECPEDEYFIRAPRGGEREIREVEKLRKEFKDTPELFLLNQVLFSVMFFQNYEQELADATPNESNISVMQLSLTDDHFLTCLKPDDALSLVNQHVQFRPTHGANKNKESPLVSNRIFVIHENIQVVAKENHYAQIDRPSLTAQIIEKHRKGYVRLKYIEDLKFKSSVSSTSSSLTNSDSSSVDDTSETYGHITNARTIKPLPTIEAGKLQKSLDPITEVRRRNDYAENDDDLYITEYFVNSKIMREQFRRNWPHIAKMLQLDNKEIETGFNCDSIFCLSKTCGSLFEVIPAVQLPKGAYESFLKIKSANIDAQLAQSVHRVFPNKAMLREIAHMDRLAIPRGFISKYKNEVNQNCHLEWELAHPKVEKFLQQLLTHTHVRVLLLMVLVLKTFVEPKSTTQGVTIRHLVIHLFWELQNDVVISETRMGTRLMKMITSFCKRLSKSDLPDYFVEGRNHFENIPSHYLRHALVEFSRTKDKPLLGFMAAIRNLHYKHVKFPELNVKELHDILTRSMAPGRKKGPQPRQTKLDWEGRQRAKLMKQKQTVTENLKPERKASIDSILESTIHIETNETVEQLRRDRKLLTFFLDHFTDMAYSLNSQGNQKQALTYLRQGELITYLFHKSQESDARKYQRSIQDLRKSFNEHKFESRVPTAVYRTPSDGPTLPERAASMYLPPLRVINQNTMDMSKVLHHHQNGDRRSKVCRKHREGEGMSGDEDSIGSDSDSTDEEVTLPSQTRLLAFRKRCESEKTAKTDISGTDVEAKPRKAKSVNFSAETIVEKNPNVPTMAHSSRILGERYIVKRQNVVDRGDSSDTSSIEEDENLDGLDEIMTDDEDASRETIIQFTNRFDTPNNKIDLGYEAEDTFT